MCFSWRQRQPKELGMSNTPQNAKDLFPENALISRLTLVFLGCLLSSLFAIYLLRQPDSAAFIWFANGFAIAVITLAPTSQRFSLICAAFMAILSANLLWGDDILQSLFLSAANTATITVGMASLSFATKRGDPFFTQRAFRYFIGLTVLLTPLTGAFLGGYTLHLALAVPFNTLATAWYLGDVIGFLAITPITYVLLKRPQLSPTVAMNPRAVLLIVAAVMFSGWLITEIHFPFIAIAVILMLTGAVLDRLPAFTTTFFVSLVLDFLLVKHSFIITAGTTDIGTIELLIPIAGAMLLGMALAVKSANVRQIQMQSDEKASLFSNAMQASVIGMVIVSPDGKILNANRSFTEFSGFSETELNVRPFKQLMFPADKTLIDEKVSELASANIDDFQMELRFLRKNKDVCWAKIAVSAVREAWSNDVIHFIFQVQDIDKHRRLEAERQLWAKKFQFALSFNKLAIYELECHTKYLHFSDNSLPIIGISMGAIHRLYEWMARIHPDDLHEYQHAIANVGTSSVTLEYRLLDDNQCYRWVRDCCQPLENEEGSGTKKRVLGTIADITAEREALESIKHVAERADLATSVGNLGVWEYCPNTGKLIWDACMRDLYACQDAELVSLPWWREHVLPDDIAAFNKILPNHSQSQADSKMDAANNRTVSTTFRIVLNDGQIKHIYASGSRVLDDQGQPRIVGLNTDISDVMTLNHTLRTEKDRLSLTLHTMKDGIITLDAAQRVTFINEHARQLSHLHSDVMGVNIEKCITWYTDDAETPFNALLEQASISLATTQVHKQFTLHLGSISSPSLTLTIAPLSEPSPCAIQTTISSLSSPSLARPSLKLVGWVLTLRKQENAANNATLPNFSTTHDYVTGLMNRQGLEHALRNHAEEQMLQRGDHTLAVLRITGLDEIERHASRPAKNQILKSVSLTLRAAARQNDLLAKISDDDFAILLRGCPKTKAHDFLKDVTEKIEQLHYQTTPSNNKDNALYVSCVAGLTSANASGIAPYHIINEAEFALESASTSDHTQISNYNELVGADAESAQNTLLDRLDNAISSSSFSLLCMPIVPNHNGLTTWHEVLVRMITEEGELLAPKSFIDSAEPAGRLNDIERWVFNEVLVTQAVALKDCQLFVAINLSESAFHDDTFINDIVGQIKRSTLPARQLCIEIEESTLMRDVIKAVNTVATFRKIGCHIAVDNFGSEMASFSYLRRFDISMVKIDGDMISLMSSSHVDKKIVESIKHISESLNAITVAQRVNKNADLNLVQEMGIHYTQGFVFGEPVPLSRIISSSKAGLLNAQGYVTSHRKSAG
ncbi:EAL domain-containing protein [Enterovibrio norvegicus]|nr:EAL domain-containing protein [Enterovibrio norvegicus]